MFLHFHLLWISAEMEFQARKEAAVLPDPMASPLKRILAPVFTKCHESPSLKCVKRRQTSVIKNGDILNNLIICFLGTVLL